MMRRSRSNSPDDAHDRIEWYQIFVGYGVVGIMLLVLLMLLAGFDDRYDARGAGSIVVVAVIAAAMALRGPMNAFQRDVLAERPGLEDALQWLAVIVLLLLSLGTCALGIVTIPSSGW